MPLLKTVIKVGKIYTDIENQNQSFNKNNRFPVSDTYYEKIVFVFETSVCHTFCSSDIMEKYRKVLTIYLFGLSVLYCFDTAAPPCAHTHSRQRSADVVLVGTRNVRKNETLTERESLAFGNYQTSII